MNNEETVMRCEARTEKMNNEETVMSEDTQLSTDIHT